MKKFFTGLGLLLVFEITRTIGLLLLSMFLGPVWVLMLASVVFCVIFVRCFYHWRLSSGPKKREYLSTLSQNPEEDETKPKRLLREVVFRTGFKGDLLVSLFVIPLGAYYLTAMKNVFFIPTEQVTGFVILLSIAVIAFFAVTDCIIWLLVIRRWIINYRETIKSDL